MLIELSLSRARGSNLQGQLVDQIRAHIRSGALQPGASLPSSRELAGQLGISRNTITQAYERLIDEGYLEAAKGIGTRVAPVVPDDCQIVAASLHGPPSAKSAAAVRTPVVFRGATLSVPLRPVARPAIDFWPGRPNREHFPLSTWRRLAGDVLATSSAKLVEYGDPLGLPELREGIARHLSAARGLTCTPESVVVTAGTQEALNLLARMFVEKDTGVVIENPGYGSAADTFASYGARLMPVPVDAHGIDVERLPKGASLAYVTPSHQFPTGALLAGERRDALLEWADRTGAYVVEDDYDCDVTYSGRPQLALAGTRPDGAVIYVGTLSKALGAGVRTGYIVFPRELLDAARAVKTMTNYGHPWLDQAILAAFLRGETFQRHLRLIRKAYLGTLEHLTCCMNAELGPVEFWGRQSGMHVMWRLPQWIGSASAFKARLEEFGVFAHTIASGGAFDADSGYGDNSLLLGYAALREDEVATAAKIIAKVAEAGAGGGRRARAGRLRVASRRQSV